MKIPDVRTFIVHNGRRNCLFVTVHTAHRDPAKDPAITG